MPELPEVETIRRGLVGAVLNKKIVQVEVRERKAFIGDEKEILNTKITQVRRRGKALLIDLNNELTMMVHLRMTGQVIWRVERGSGGVVGDGLRGLGDGGLGGLKKLREDERGGGLEELAEGGVVGDGGDLKEVVSVGGVVGDFAGGHPTEDFVMEMPGKHSRVIFGLTGGKLFFNDQRKFGFVKVIRTAEVEQEDFIRRLGKEPWGMEVEEFYEILQRRGKANVKAVILNQENVAGVGNIYADEALFFAGVDPRRRAGTLSCEEAEQLLLGMREVMEASIASGGSTMATYVRADGTRGNYLEAFAKVFGREGEKCARCGGEVQKIRVAGRGTHYCGRCQR